MLDFRNVSVDKNEICRVNGKEWKGEADKEEEEERR